MNAWRRTAGLCALALLCSALVGAHARADSKHARSDDPLADADSDEDVVASAPPEEALPAPEPTESEAQPEATSSEAAAAAEGATEPSLEVEVFVGGGIGTRALERPTRLGVQRLDTTVFPAIEAGLRIVGWPHAAFSLGGLLRYQTGLGTSVREQPPFALDNEVAVRSERVELSVAPMLRLGDAPEGLALAFPIGLTLRTFWPDVHNSMTPGYSLGGPLLRAELIAAWGDLLALRLGPELQWIVLIDHAVTDDGVASQAVAIGGEATLSLRATAVFAIQLYYRESHALAQNARAGGASFSDVERFLTLGLSGRL